MGGGVSSLPAEVTLAEAKELAGAKWQPAWEEKFAEADAKISKDEALRCWNAKVEPAKPLEKNTDGARKTKGSTTAKGVRMDHARENIGPQARSIGGHLGAAL